MTLACSVRTAPAVNPRSRRFVATLLALWLAGGPATGCGLSEEEAVARCNEEMDPPDSECFSASAFDACVAAYQDCFSVAVFHSCPPQYACD